MDFAHPRGVSIDALDHKQTNTLHQVQLEKLREYLIICLTLRKCGVTACPPLFQLWDNSGNNLKYGKKSVTALTCNKGYDVECFMLDEEVVITVTEVLGSNDADEDETLFDIIMDY